MEKIDAVTALAALAQDNRLDVFRLLVRAGPEGMARWHEVNTVVFEIVLRMGGSISAEHGIGVLKRDELPDVKDKVAIELMRGIKAMLDPLGIMIAGFNRGYNGFQQTYRTCTPAASVAIRRFIEEGSKISRDLTARYAN